MNDSDKILVMGFGTFDTLHPGHLFYMQALKALGDELIMVVARDKSVLRIKGRSSQMGETERLQAVQEAGIADLTVLGSETDFYEVIRTHEPHILGFGYDQQVSTGKLKAAFPKIRIERVEAHYPEKYKSSIIKGQKK